MEPTPETILADIVQTLREAGGFSQVVLGQAPAGADLPRASVRFDGLDESRPDDRPDGRWFRLRARIVIHTRSAGTSEAVTRTLELSRSAAAALLEDPYRGQRCRDLPIGKATEVSHCAASAAVKLPEAEATLTVHCHFELAEGE